MFLIGVFVCKCSVSVHLPACVHIGCMEVCIGTCVHTHTRAFFIRLSLHHECLITTCLIVWHYFYTGTDMTLPFSVNVRVVAGKSKQTNNGRLEVLFMDFSFVLRSMTTGSTTSPRWPPTGWWSWTPPNRERWVALWFLRRPPEAAIGVSVIQRFPGEMNVLGQDWIMEESEGDLYWSCTTLICNRGEYLEDAPVVLYY